MDAEVPAFLLHVFVIQILLDRSIESLYMLKAVQVTLVVKKQSKWR